MAVRLVLFDVDGVLVDSLASHLQICRELAGTFALSIEVPEVAAFKALVRRGVRISPMPAFFAAVGFPAEVVAEAVRAYESGALAHHAPLMFAEAPDVLRALHARGLALGLVTANVRRNVWPALGDSAALFREDCVFTYDDPRVKTKAAALREALRRTGLRADEALFIGDQPADEEAAREAGVPFLAASYGWGFDPGPARLANLGELLARLEERPSPGPV